MAWRMGDVLWMGVGWREINFAEQRESGYKFKVGGLATGASHSPHVPWRIVFAIFPPQGIPIPETQIGKPV